MPLYEYQCEKCSAVFEVMQKFADEPLTTHEKCGGAVHRLLSAPALQFKGTGWYITDYAKNSSSSGKGGAQKGESSGKTDSGNSSGKEAGGASSSEGTKPAPSSNPKS